MNSLCLNEMLDTAKPGNLAYQPWVREYSAWEMKPI